MEELDEEVYTTIFNALRHGVRRNILRMLKKQEQTFSTMEEKLQLSSSHLTYHLEALKELVTKTSEGYKLSVFGEAAVDMIEKVENPPYELSHRKQQYKQASVILLAITLLMSGMFGHSRLQVNELKVNQTLQNNEIKSLQEKLEIYEFQKEQLQNRMETHFSEGLIGVVGWTVEYKHDFTRERGWFDENKYPPYHYAIFYALADDLTLQLKPGKYLTPDDFAYPLTIQKGHAWWNESGVRSVKYFFGEEQILWASPVIWQQNISSTDIIEVQLEEAGWYTLCMTGPIEHIEGSGVTMKIGVATENEGEEQYPLIVNTWIDFRLLKDGESVPFNLWSRE